MYNTEVRSILCPYCGESIDLIIDTSVEQQQYVEDCHVCCQPILLTITIFQETEDSQYIDIQAGQENE